MHVASLDAGHVYQLPNGWSFVATDDGDRYALLSRSEWRHHMVAALAVRADGVVTMHGFDTGWRLSDLRRIGPVEWVWRRHSDSRS